jgi:predicted nucleic acid-binding protein
MKCFVDTNLLLRSVQSSHPMSSTASGSINSLLQQGEQLFIFPQTVIEFWCVATRPESVNGLGLSIAETTKRINAFRQALTLLPDTEGTFGKWERIVEDYQVTGKKVFDARLVAAMIIHNVSHILTFNTDDFKRYGEIKVVHPEDINEIEQKA